MDRLTSSAAHGRRHRRVAGLLLAAAVSTATALSAAGCGGGAGAAGSTGGGTLRFGDALSNIDATNPFVGTNVLARAAYEQTYPELVQYGYDNQITGDFAKSWTFGDDGRTLTMKTAADAKWSDGRPLTSRDAAWTLNTAVKYKDGPTAAFGSGIDGLVSAEAPDATTLVLHYSRAAGTALSQLRRVPILPQHVWAPHVGSDGKGLQSFRNEAPIVSGGPFIWTTFKKDQVALFKRNPNYYGKAPRLEGFGIQHYSSNDALLQSLKNGEIDAALELNGVEANSLKGMQGIKVKSGPGWIWDALGINSNPKRTDHRELLDPDVRMAFAKAIDTKELNDRLQLGYAQPTATQIPVGEFSDPSLKPVAVDVAGANALLDRLGYRKGANGIRVADGHPMSYQLDLSTGFGSSERVAQLLTASLARIGVKVDAKIMDGSAFWDRVTGPDYKYTNSQLFVESWSNYPDPDFSLSLQTCAQLGGLNETGYCNKDYDKLYQRQASEIDVAKRKPIVYRLQQMLYRDRPFSVFYNEPAIEGWRAQWTGYGRMKGSTFSALSKFPLIDVHRAS
ncbi:MAG TPA: peptide ABC transporter substrate-binding protein [Baekduia sp.]|uniref:ABC transporter substrate-binding protein n=1 Tax=Baekduia sp. TaxID=2600305 RepID=UPI002D770ABF|nr:peptide ABC transporter substrate-binding protein [Baekduia sp.]HET6509905.1 peptide ABC transporter substrate-binding protein [Baekduia sp.]